MAQIIRTIGYAEGGGYKSNSIGDKVVDFNYDGYDFGLDNMPDVASYGSATGEQIDAVAKLMLACGLSVNMNYTPIESGANSYNVSSALVNNFGYDKEYTIYYSREMSIAKWESIIYRELQLKRPVYYSGQNSNSGHAFVVDGYGGNGMWHINWGWGGASNGYYRLSALNPDESGIGGFVSGSGYNYSQCLVKAVPSGYDSGMVPSSIAGSIKSVGNGVYAVYFRSLGIQNMDVTLGAVIVDDDGNQVAQARFWSNQNLTSTTTLYMNEFRYDFSRFDLEEGNYKIYPSMAKSDDSAYIIADIFDGRQHYVNLTVDGNGNYVYANSDDASQSASYDICLSDVEQREFSMVESDITFTLVNNGRSDYGAGITVGIAELESTTMLCDAKIRTVIIPAEYNATVSASLTLKDPQGAVLSPGRYRVLVADSDGNLLNPDDSFEVTLRNLSSNGWTVPYHLAIYNIDSAPSSLISGQKWNHVVQIKNDNEQRVQLQLSFYNPGETYRINAFTLYSGILGELNDMMSFDSPVIDMPFGIYEVAYTDSWSEISDRRIVKIGVEHNGLYYMPVSDTEVAVVAHPQRAYSGNVVIPNTVIIDGKQYSVTALAPQAFCESRNLESIDIPASVVNIGVNAFASCPAVTHIIMRADTLSFGYRNHVAPGLTDDADIYVPHTVYEQCREIMAGHNNVYALIESLESKDIEIAAQETQEVIAVNPVSSGVNNQFSITYEDADTNPAAEVSINSVEPGRIILHITALHPGEALFAVRSAQQGLEPAYVRVIVPDTGSIDGVSVDETLDGALIYDLQGRKLTRRQLRPGRIVVIVAPQGTQKRVCTKVCK